MIPKCLVLCSNCLDDQPVNTLAHRRATRASVPSEQAEFVSWPGFWECGCNPAARAMNFMGDTELANTWEFHREESVHTHAHSMVRGGERRTGREEPAGRMRLFWWSRSCRSDWLCLSERGAKRRWKGGRLQALNICTSDAAVKYLEQVEEMSLAHLRTLQI